MLIGLLEKLLNGFFALVPRPRPNSLLAQQALLIAHRGAHDASLGIVENTDAAFQLAKELGYWGMEFDVHLTADNVLVINHDPTLTRLWGQEAAIAALTFQQVRALAPFVPTLDEVVRKYGGHLHLLIELKVRLQDQSILVQALQPLTACKDYHLLALDPEPLTALTQFPKTSLLLVPVHNNVKKFCAMSIKENYAGVLGNYLLLTNGLIKTLREAQQIIGVGFVNSKYSLYRELNRGNQWLFTDKAVKLSHYLKELA